MHQAAAIADLPDDVGLLKRLLAERDVVIGTLVSEVNAGRAQLAAERNESSLLRVLIDKLKLQLAVLRRAQFGRSSEQMELHAAQLELMIEDLEAAQAALPDPGANSAAATPARRQPVRRAEFPAHLAREDRVHEPIAAASGCPACGQPMRRLGEDVAEQLEYVPASFRVIRHVRPKWACRCCEHIEQVAV